MSTLEHIGAFIERVRRRLPTDKGNILAASLGAWMRYRNFLQIILDRYEKASREFVEETRRTLTDETGTRQLTALEMEALRRQAAIGRLLHLEIESFYIFAKILLDRIADSFGFYFGVQWKASGSTHTQLATALSKKQLQPAPMNLADTIMAAKERIVDYRTGWIEHIDEPRLIHATTFTADGKTGIYPVVLHPQGGG